MFLPQLLPQHFARPPPEAQSMAAVCRPRRPLAILGGPVHASWLPSSKASDWKQLHMILIWFLYVISIWFWYDSYMMNEKRFFISMLYLLFWGRFLGFVAFQAHHTPPPDLPGWRLDLSQHIRHRPASLTRWWAASKAHARHCGVRSLENFSSRRCLYEVQGYDMVVSFQENMESTWPSRELEVDRM